MPPFANKKDLIKEILCCGKDPVYFLKKYANIEHPIRGLIPFETFAYQDDLLQAYIKNRFNVILKARQLGITTITGGFIAWLLIFHRHQNVLVVATKQEAAKTTLRVVKTIIKSLPKWIMPGIVSVEIDNRTSMELTNGSRIKAVTTSDDVGRSEAISLLFVDECAHIDKMQEIWTGLWPTLSTGGRAILSSTPNGAGNFFHSCWEQARDGIGSFNCRFGKYINPRNPEEVYEDRLMWWVHPEHDTKWFEDETADKSRRDTAQEYLCGFNTSGETFLDPETLSRIESQIKEPISREHFDRNLYIWKQPEVNGVYLVTSDVSRGDAKDFSTAQVIRLDTHLEQVAEYKGKIRPDMLGELLIDISKKYNNAIIAVENNSGYGGQTIHKIQELNYPFLYYYRRRRQKIKDLYSPVPDPYYAENNNDYLSGYSVNSVNRLPMLAKMEQYLRQNTVIVYSERLLSELKTFIVNTESRPEAMRGYNDDLVMAFAGAIWVREESFMAACKIDDISKSMISSISTSVKTTNNINEFNKNSSIYDRARIVEHMNEQNKIKLANGDVLDISWLISRG